MGFTGEIMKKAIIISSLKQANDIKDLVDAFMVPITDYSINFPNTFTLEEVGKLKKFDQEIFLIMNKNIYNEELDTLTNLLKQIETLNIKGIVFYDIAFIQLKKELQLKTDLVWAQEHLVTNYETINYWYDKGAKYAYLSSELTKEEITEIKEKAKAKLFINVFGYIPMFTSKRHLINNYLDYFNLEKQGTNKHIFKEGKHYPIIDDKHGTTVFSNYILNILDEDFLNDYLVFNSTFISDKDFKEVLTNYQKFPFEHGFLYQETIYKVKKDE